MNSSYFTIHAVGIFIGRGAMAPLGPNEAPPMCFSIPLVWFWFKWAGRSSTGNSRQITAYFLKLPNHCFGTLNKKYVIYTASSTPEFK